MKNNHVVEAGPVKHDQVGPMPIEAHEEALLEEIKKRYPDKDGLLSTDGLLVQRVSVDGKLRRQLLTRSGRVVLTIDGNGTMIDEAPTREELPGDNITSPAVSAHAVPLNAVLKGVAPTKALDEKAEILEHLGPADPTPAPINKRL